jgi:hypothetical protein
MASTTFTNNVTLTDADWFNDLNRLHYAILGDPADAAAVKTALGIDLVALTNPIKIPCRVATTAAINLAAPGAAIDAVTMAAGDRFLDKDNATAASRGIYVWNGAAVPATRATDADGAGELLSGMLVTVSEGTVNGKSVWMLTTPNPITIGTTALTFERKDAGAAGHGQCVLAKSGANILLSPKNGNKLIINGSVQSIPSAGVSLAATGLTAGTSYFIYAYMNSGTMTLEASATGHSTDAATGVEIKTGDATRSLVGLIRAITGPAFADTDTQRFVISWFNRRAIGMANGFSANRSTASTTYVELHTEIRCEFLTWGDESVSAAQASWVAASGASSEFAAVAFDGTTPENGGVGNYIPAGTTVNISTTANKSGLAEGYHYATLIGKAQSTFTATWYGAAANGDRSILSVMIRG